MQLLQYNFNLACSNCKANRIRVLVYVCDTMDADTYTSVHVAYKYSYMYVHVHVHAVCEAGGSRCTCVTYDMLVYVACSLPLMPDGETIDMRYMPTLCNGHIGTQPFGNAVYMNPLFTGDDGESAVENVRICPKKVKSVAKRAKNG